MKGNMNRNRVYLPTRFAAETRFEVRPNPFRAAQENEFERLKAGLLTDRLRTADMGLNAPLRRAANDAAAIAWATPFPLLVLPVLFDEKAEAAVRQAERQARIYRSTREMTLVE